MRACPLQRPRRRPCSTLRCAARTRSAAHPRPGAGGRTVDDGRLHALRVKAGAAGAALPTWLPTPEGPAQQRPLRWSRPAGAAGGPLVAHLQGDPEQNYATAIGSLLEALHGRWASRYRFPCNAAVSSACSLSRSPESESAADESLGPLVRERAARCTEHRATSQARRVVDPWESGEAKLGLGGLPPFLKGRPAPRAGATIDRPERALRAPRAGHGQSGDRVVT
jgi:hypothetical protein